ncbi:MAG: nucleotidyltransferase [Planctomycetota bacterium]|nr:MAG: nucleotidyltransferase [Planctomycetota bacterium]
MTPDEYLKKVLKQQTFATDAPELKDLRKRRTEIKGILEGHFSESSPSIRWAGSMAKDTMIKESYDGDMTCYFPHDEDSAGKTLEEIYNNVAELLGKDYDVERKASALRVKNQSTKATKGFAEDLHVDVVPGRFTDDDEGDVFMHRTTGEKERLKTNLQVHIDHIRDSGVRDAIRMMKYWNARNAIGAKTFVLELLVVKLLADKKDSSLSEQLTHVLTEFRDSVEGLSVEDPANSNNDLKPALDSVRYMLSSVARTTLSTVDSSGWEGAFGKLDSEDEEDSGERRKAALHAAAIQVRESRPGTRPWYSGA